ncbi:MAG: tetratricopeptide repeat protein [Gemmatimonadota bacterium]
MRYPWLAIAAVCALVYSNSLQGSFHYDDEHSVEQNINLRDLANVPRFFVDPAMFSVDADKGMYRPVLLVTYALNFAAGGFGVEGYHLVNVAIHVANACLLAWLALLLGAGPARALLAGLLFAVHPVCSEPVSYISSRSESLAGLFYLLGLSLYVRGKGEGRWAMGALASLAAGLLTKSTVITLPVCFLLYDYLYLSGGDLRRLRARLRHRHLATWVVTGAYLVTIVVNGFLTRSAGSRVRGWTEQAATQTKALAYYVHLVAAPVRQSVEPQFKVAGSLGEAPVVLALGLAASVLAVVALSWRWRPKKAVFLFLWAAISLAPVLVFPLNVLVNERRAYLACAALCVALADLLPQVRVGRQAPWALSGLALVVVLGTLTWQRNRAWADEFSLWSDAVTKAPLMPRTHLYLGNAHKDAALRSRSTAAALPYWAEAAAQYQRVIDIGTDAELSVLALNNIGGVHYKLGELSPPEAAQRLDLAEAAYRRAVELRPRYADALVNLANVRLARARSAADPSVRRQILQESVELYGRALEVRPNHYQAHGNLGVAYQDMGQLDLARQEYTRALTLDPRDYSTLGNMGGLLLQLSGVASQAGVDGGQLLRQARSYFQQSLSLNPSYEPAQRGAAEAEQRLRQLGG